VDRFLKRLFRTGLLRETPPEPARESLAGPPLPAVFRRALTLRHVDAGSCNGCELELHATQNARHNLAALGIRFAASPRHADVLVVTGPVARSMEGALLATHAAMPDPKRVLAVGDCACGTSPFADAPACRGSVGRVLPVDARVAGCPPPPEAVIAALRAIAGEGGRNEGVPPPRATEAPNPKA
jgi:Ni,Fe-hydrogenase III small subunit